MDTYVVRIYRRDKRNTRKVAGQIELIEQEQTRSFTCVEELVKILELREKQAHGNPKKRKRNVRGPKKVARFPDLSKKEKTEER